MWRPLGPFKSASMPIVGSRVAAPGPVRVGVYAPRRMPCGGLWTRSGRRLSPFPEALWRPLDTFRPESMPLIRNPVAASGPVQVGVFAQCRQPCGGLRSRSRRRLSPLPGALRRPLDPYKSAPMPLVGRAVATSGPVQVGVYAPRRVPCGGLWTCSSWRPCPASETLWWPLGPLTSTSTPIIDSPVAASRPVQIGV